MEDQLISFETAKLCKEKGFNGTATSLFDKEGEIVPVFYWDHSSTVSEIMVTNEDLEKHEYLRPTQSLVQRWLRETHGIYVESYHDSIPGNQGILYFTSWGFINDPQSKNYKYCAGGGYDEEKIWRAYEDALEYGLKEGLKLVQ